MIFNDRIVISREYVKPAKSTKQARTLSPEELLKGSYNVKHRDGRIYYKKDENGYHISFSVSPYAERYLDNIEDDIKELVLSLKRKGYLTVSSCQGHTNFERTFVTIVVNNDTHVSSLKEALSGNFMVQVIERNILEFGNNKVEVGNNKIKINKCDDEERNEQDIVNGFNALVSRGYAQYKVVDLQVGYDLLKPTRFKLLKRLANRLLRKFGIAWATKRIKNLIEYDM
jgi:hypothetical protein